MELIKNPMFVMIGEFKELKMRNDFKKELDDIDKKVSTIIWIFLSYLVF